MNKITRDIQCRSAWVEDVKGSQRTFKLSLLLVLTSCLTACAEPSGDDPRPLEDPSVYQDHDSTFRSSVEEVVLAPGAGTEVMMVLAAKQVIVYQWTVEGGEVYSDFHGHDPDDTSYWVQYRESAADMAAYGSLVAPFNGEHGWYFRNDGQSELVISIRTNGFFSDVINHSKQ